MPSISDDDWFLIQASYVHFMKHVHFLAAQKVLPSESALLTHQMEHWWNATHKRRDLRRGYDMVQTDDNSYEYYSPMLNHRVSDKPPWDDRDTLHTQTPAPAEFRRPVPPRKKGWLWGETGTNPYVIE